MNKDTPLAILIALLLLPLLLIPFLPSDRGGPLAPPPATGSPPYHTYRVRPGDTLSEIAVRYGIPLSYLIASNDIRDPSFLRPGQSLVLPQGGVIHTVRQGQRIEDIAKTYGVTEEAIRIANRLTGDPLPGEKILVPEPRVVPQLAAIELGQSSGTLFIWPCRGPISSPFGWRIHPIYRQRHLHTGLDIAVPEGTPIHAAKSGRVVEAGWQGGYGLLVAIDHGNGYSTYYGHLSRILVAVGQFVEAGQVVALSGNTGLSTGPHLHFEVRAQGVPVDPAPLLP